ncbi:thiolase domain-containing protein [Aeromicrobium sp. 636]|uniref:Thiolase domain-containing protein n=1 Tax=Aeromicrobium senzhongii TaxID=2663859 RepID=A0A8I0EWD7_9ACTN|nr:MULTISPECIES: acetyl-CoA acetyltransferase [Aeromicrobium]MBC9227475.1 thiolase domain-containing protein [Aeromicrobium senzhongii]MCQ3999572.1 thiolase domain-containing protein [Aeromicrobium sp. 636]MTB88102.1 thiolase domain-containing protein [Aeromicrobium senzhongii]QNL94901.1 thiolase domain-containing protein [Aeromicrobium senzhongii]
MTKSPNVWVLGGYQTDFARNFHREGKDFADLATEVVDGTLAASGLDAEEIGVVHVGNAFGQLFAGQGQLGALPATVNPGLWGTPSSRHEAACASGSIAVLAAMADLRAGNYDTALVVGIELEKTVSGDQAAHHLGAAAWAGHEGEDATFMWPYMFSQVAEEYDRRYGIDQAHLSRIAEINFANAKLNPNAQTRGWDVPDLGPAGDPALNPPVDGRVRRFDCSQITDGGSGIVLVSDEFLVRHPDLRPMARIAGWGHQTVGLGLQQKLDHSADQPYVMPHLRRAVLDAFDRAQIGLDDLDALETHDCFTPSEYIAIDHIGLTEPGESWKAIENGDIEIGGRLPINPSGGLIGGGHPVGASGIRMVLDATKQVTGTAGGYQVDGADTVGTLNFGGSTATTVSFVVTAN